MVKQDQHVSTSSTFEDELEYIAGSLDRVTDFERQLKTLFEFLPQSLEREHRALQRHGGKPWSWIRQLRS